MPQVSVPRVARDDSASLRAHFAQTASLLELADTDELSHIVELFAMARAERRRIFIFGNGGSAATAMHLATDLSLLRFDVVCLSTNMPLVSALANDIEYAEVFARQLSTQARRGDVVLGISASGNSPNCVAALRQARALGAIPVSFVAFDGGAMRMLSDACLHVPIDDYRLAENVHLVASHALAAALAP